MATDDTPPARPYSRLMFRFYNDTHSYEQIVASMRWEFGKTIIHVMLHPADKNWLEYVYITKEGYRVSNTKVKDILFTSFTVSPL